MEREHRRYFRHKVDLPVELLCQTGETFAGKMMNVSEVDLPLLALVLHGRRSGDSAVRASQRNLKSSRQKRM